MKVISQKTKDIISEAFHQADLDRSGLRQYERDLYGASGGKIKHTINSICSIKEGLDVLELGIYRGSTLAAINYNTKNNYYGIDDFSIDYKEANVYKEDGWNNARLAARDMAEKYKTNDNKIRIIETDAKKPNFNLLPKKIDIIHYDLDEHHANFENVIRQYISLFEKYTIIMISNWNSQGLRNSFTRFSQTPGIAVEMLGEKLSRTTGDTKHWYNGFAVFLIQSDSKELDK